MQLLRWSAPVLILGVRWGRYPQGSKGLADVIKLLLGMRGAHAAPEQAPSVRSGGRQNQVHVYAALEEAGPDGKGFFPGCQQGRHNGAGLRPEDKAHTPELLIEVMGVIPELPAQLGSVAQDSEGDPGGGDD